MLIDTKHMGQIEIKGEDIIHFSNGLPGFEDTTDFVLIKLNDEVPFSFFQAVHAKEVSFIVADPFMFSKDYSFELDSSLTEELKIENAEQVVILSIVRLGESLETSTLNLLAPIVINSDNKLGKQVILHDSKYQIKHLLVTV